MTILLPKFRHIKPNKPFKSNVGLSCEVKCLLYDSNMNLRQDTGWHRNLILDNGLDNIWTNNWLGYTSIGIGTTAPVTSDTALEFPVATIATVIGAGNQVRVGAIAPNYEYSETRSRRFGAGIGTGLITEVGAGYSGTLGQDLYNRLLLPIPVNKGAENVLDVILRQTIWPDLTDYISSATFKGISYDTITRIKDCDGFDGSTAWDKFIVVDSGTSIWIAYDGAIGPITGGPAGINDRGGTGDGWSYGTYTPGDFYRTITYKAGLEDWVLINGIRCLVGSINLLQLQTQFTEAAGQPNPGDSVPKDNTEIMDFSWRYTWGRRP